MLGMLLRSRRLDAGGSNLWIVSEAYWEAVLPEQLTRANEGLLELRPVSTEEAIMSSAM